MIIDPKLHSRLREKYNPDGSLLRRHQLRMLEILKYKAFQQIVIENGVYVIVIIFGMNVLLTRHQRITLSHFHQESCNVG